MTPDRFAAIVPDRDDFHEHRLHRIDPALGGSGRHGSRPLRDRHRRRLMHDDTARLAERALSGRGVIIETCAGSAGQARAIGTSQPLARWVTRRSPVWTVHTDADSVVPEGWLHHQRRVAEIGLAAVAGVVEIASFAEHSRRGPLVATTASTPAVATNTRTSTAPTSACAATPTGPSAAGRPSPAVRTTRCGTPSASLGIRRCRPARSTLSPAGDGSDAPDGFAAHLHALGEAV